MIVGASRLSILLELVFLWLSTTADGFLFSALVKESPRNYSKGERVDLFVNKLTSHYTLLPMEHDMFPFCPTEDVKFGVMEEFGDFWTGNHWKKALYRLNMKEDVYCEQLCVSNVGHAEQPLVAPSRVVQAIRNHYRHNWSIDNGLPAGGRIVVSPRQTQSFLQGFSMGYIGDDGQAYIYNHVNIEIFIQPMEDGTYRIVRSTVHLFSIHHETGETWEDRSVSKSERGRQMAEIKNPIHSCDPELVHNAYHTNFSMVSDGDHRPQAASGRVLFTYDVIWTEAEDLTWATRWDAYLTENLYIPDEVHTYAIVNSVVFLFIFMATMAVLIKRSLKKTMNLSKSVSNNGDEVVICGWKAVSADVFRPPTSSPMLLVVCCGAGAQLFFSAVLTLLSLYFGLLSPTKLRNVFMGGLLFYVLCGSINGYVTGRFLKTFQCTEWSRAMALASIVFPCFVFASLIGMKIIYWLSFPVFPAVPLAPILLLLLAFALSVLLFLVGGYVGYQQDAIGITFPITSNPRRIPKYSKYAVLPVTLATGILPFICLYVELYFLLTSFWFGLYYCTFGFLLVVLVMTILTIVAQVVSLTFLRLQREDYHWWWRSFFNGGSVAVFTFGHAFLFLFRARSMVSISLYFGYIGLLSISFFLMTGFLGVASSLWFNLILYMGKAA